MRRRQQKGMTAFKVGVIGLILSVIVVYLGFTKALPFRQHFEINAVFQSSNNLRPNSPVRIAGVEVGKVTKVELLGDGARRTSTGEEPVRVTMRIEEKGRPIHKDAEAFIRPRIFLEGNFFVDVNPGTPQAPALADGDTIPFQQTRVPVQIDQILTALQTDTRRDLQTLLREYSHALGGEGGKGFNRSIRWWEPAYKNSALVNQAVLGLTEGDLRGYIKNAGAVAQALDRQPEQLKNLITFFNRTAAAFAREDRNLEAAISELPRTLRAAQPALAALNASFPPLRRLAHDFRPAVRSSGPTIDESLPFIRQARLLMGRDELRGLVADLRATVPSLARLNERQIPLQRQVRLASSCQNEVVVPWSKDRIQDPVFPATGPVYEEQAKTLPGLGGESRSGDANGQWFRVLLANGNNTAIYAPDFIAPLRNPLQGANPPKPAGRPPISYRHPCETQERPDLRTIAAAPPPQTKARISTAAGRRRYARAKALTLQWARDQIEREGLQNQLRVSNRELTREQLNQLRGGRDFRKKK